MTESKQWITENRAVGDAAVDGLFRGVLAGAGMAFYLVVVGLFSAESPETILARFGPSETTSALTGALLHLAVAAVYGILFGLAWRLFSRRWRNKWSAALAGLVYGALLFVVSQLIVPATASPLQGIAPLHFAVAHPVYGMTLGLLFNRGG